MKKSILSIALLLSVFLVSAKNDITEKTPTKHFNLSTNVNAFCKLIQMGDYDAVRALIEEGENINLKSSGLTPLMFAARHNKTEIAKLLIENGAKLKLKSSKNGFTALKWAEASNAKETYAVIKNALQKKKNKKRNKK
ncbi:ankyrin repeat domain-containing protein [Lutibacter sp. A80]|uniref:ankyrin repeat domain-containing protein n=1 Tax=Lutibacter sp. A80 TaxID=2918453 RepID=UPI001F06D45A|nr:ankyrin repeat domain-containing protein [Lutibacter sp. A80]UMB59308.1 ankyrin repeat domain-containing protein [Lutibacter sp. A80]